MGTEDVMLADIRFLSQPIQFEALFIFTRQL